MGPKTYSIQDHFAGSTVLLTGSSGYVGALTLEKLLRSTDVRRVYVLLRPKRGESVQARLQKQLEQSAVLHLIRGNPVLDKVVPIAGDMMLPELGISVEDRRTLQREVNTVVHCAADIRLEAGIQQLLTANYEGTRQLLKMAAAYDNLTAFVHVSSAYTNMNAPSGSLVKEAIYPLMYGDQLIDDYELVQELLGQPSHNANARAECLMKAWNFPNNYTLSKHLAEYMVADYHKNYKLPIAIVRPTLISSVAKDPYPGYTGNFAGHVGATLAFMAGLFDSPHASNYKGGNVWDVIPADVVIADILAAAAVVGAGMANQCCVTRTRNGRLISEPADAAVNTRWNSSMPKLPPRPAAAGGGKRRSYQVAAFGTAAMQAAPGDADGAAAANDDDEQLLIIHSGSSTLYPLTIMESWNWGIEVYGAWKTGYRLCRGCAAPLTVDHEPNPPKAATHVNWTGWKVWAAATLLKAVGEERVAKKLSVGFDSFKLLNQPKTDVNLRFSTYNLQRMAALLDPTEREDFLLVWKPQLSKLAAAPTTAAVSAAAAAAAAAAAPQAAGARLGKAADKDGPIGMLRVNSSVTEGILKMGIGIGVVPSSEAGSSRPASVDLSLPASGSSSDGDDGASSSGSPVGKAARQQRGAVLGPEQAAALAQMKAVPHRWRDFHINLGAFLYCTVFRMPEPEQLLPVRNDQVVRWLHIKPEDRWIRHQFHLYK